MKAMVLLYATMLISSRYACLMNQGHNRLKRQTAQAHLTREIEQ